MNERQYNRMLIAEQEAERFLGRVQDLKDVVVTRKSTGSYPSYTWLDFPKAESGAVQRSSLDLTRSLAKMRAR